ncbi:RNA polymerase sigma factor [Pelagicoccus mobilis]|uniref:Sigma-70 family RNA polymerase sigma factor n=1 Tax=Pelagicoccus mobilis TaxID=415221 RepID=A0A934RYB1_9BACT|nr:sigma-70 family RNA polymerase sigma factor [Pelagicoccus mobilis]MBK1878816.1 sigma-70 family RNA polymerase sigma factor [Pelagicoccus mobilis]
MNETTLQDWEALYDERSGKMLLFAKQFVGCVATAEDVVQEGFLRFWKSRMSHPEEKRESHLYGCVRWAALDYLRRTKRARVREENYSADEAALTGSQESFECPVENQETAALLEASLAKLPPEQREVVVLKVWAELTLQEIGDSLGISPNTAASRYRYALEALRREVRIFDYAD